MGYRLFRVLINYEETTPTLIMTTETPKNGLHTEYHKNGQKEFEANFKNGKEDGKWTGWHEDGQIALEGNYNNGTGTLLQFYENGQIESEGNYKDGELDGKVTEWDENGQIESEATFKDGECVSGDCDELIEPEYESDSFLDFLRDYLYVLIQS